MREWILDGSPSRMQSNPLEVERISRLMIKMPAYRGFVSYETLSDLEFYVTASGLLLPQAEDSPEGRGRAHNEGSLSVGLP